MTTQRQVERVVGPLLERHSDLVLLGRVIALKPVQHLLRFVFIDRTGTGDVFNPRWSLAYLFHRLEHLPVGLGKELYPRKKGLWRWSDSGAMEALIDVIERDALPQLRAIVTLQDCLDFMLPPGSEERKHWWGAANLFEIALGDLDAARHTLKAHPRGVRTFDDYSPGLGSRLMEQGSALSAEDRSKLAQFLHDWEAFTVEKLKLQSVWERTPFPLEMQLAQA